MTLTMRHSNLNKRGASSLGWARISCLPLLFAVFGCPSAAAQGEAAEFTSDDYVEIAADGGAVEDGYVETGAEGFIQPLRDAATHYRNLPPGQYDNLEPMVEIPARPVAELETEEVFVTHSENRLDDVVIVPTTRTREAQLTAEDKVFLKINRGVSDSVDAAQ